MLKIPVKVETECVAECFFQYVMPTVRPHWVRERIQFREFNGGYSNRIVGISQTGDDTDIILFRMHLASAQSLETLFDRDMEIKVMELLHQAGMNPPVYCRFENATCYGFAPGRPVTQEDLDNRKVRECIAVTMARYHNSIDSTGLDCKSWVDKISNWLPEMVPKDEITAEMDRMGCTLDYLKDQFRKAKALLDTFKSPKVLCHNDTHKANMIYDEKEGRVTFIDQEGVGFAHVSCEIGNFFRCFVDLFEDLDLSLYPKEDVQKDFIRLYLKEKSRLHNVVGTELSDYSIRGNYR